MTHPAPATTQPLSKSPVRWLMLALVWLLYLSFGMTVATLPPLVDPIVTDLRLTYSQMGLVLGAWQLIYIGTASPLGAMVDKLGIRRSLGIGIVIMWLSLVLRGLALDFGTLFLSVALFGVGGPIISIGAPKVVSVWFAGNQRGLAAGIYGTGPLLGSAFSLATASSLVLPLTGTWRGISPVYGAFVLAVAAAWWLLAKDAPPGHGASAHQGETRESSRAVLRQLLRLRTMRVLLVMAVASFLLNHGLNNWIPTLLHDGGMTLAEAGVWTAAATAFGAVGMLAIPSLTRQDRRLLMLGLLFGLAGVTTLGLAFLAGPTLIGSLLASALVRSPMMAMLTLVLMEARGVGAARMGAAGGLFFAAAEIGGFGGPFLLGAIRDATDSLLTGVVILAAVIGAMVLLLPLIREERPVPS